jgi:dihydrofolate synthase/folylpolyglutamate synthase
VLEVGLGGRLDATNSVEPIVSVLTDIGMDHMDYLGHTLREIATEKAGILRQDGVLVTLSQHPEANAAIGDAAMRLNVRGVDAARCLPPRLDHNLNVDPSHLDPSFLLSEQSPVSSLDPSSLVAGHNPSKPASPLTRNRYPLSLEGEILHVDSPLAGQHQQRNLALAIATAIELRSNHGFNISNSAIEQGIRNTAWPGRLEWIAGTDSAPVLLDVGHNPAGAWTLRAALSQLPESTPRTLLFSCLRDKPIAELAQVLFPLFDSTSGDPERTRDHIVLAPIDSPRATSVEDLLATAKALDIPAQSAATLTEALTLARKITPKGGIIVATGSVFLVGELRPLLLQ